MKENSIRFPASFDNTHVMKKEYWDLFHTLYEKFLDIKGMYTNPIHAMVEIILETGKIHICEMELHEEKDDITANDTIESLQEAEASTFESVVGMRSCFNGLKSIYIELGMINGPKYFINLETNKENGVITVFSGELDRDLQSDNTNEDDNEPSVGNKTEQLLKHISDDCCLLLKSKTNGYAPDSPESPGDPTLKGKVTWTGIPDYVLLEE